MDIDCKKFSKVNSVFKRNIRILVLQDLRSLDKSMREWHAYKGLETTVKNMLTSLRAVGELQNSAIRDRHW